MLGGGIWRAVAVRPRLFTGLACGMMAWLALSGASGGITRAVLAWDLGVIVYLLLAALLFTTERASHMAEDAAREQEGEWTVFSLTVAAALVSLAAIFGMFSGSRNLHGSARGLHVGLVSVTLLVSWLLTHTTFAFRYAHEFYSRDTVGADFDRGLVFPGEDRPDYLDFVYFALVLGMTFQVSDVQITSRKMRRLATVHGLLSFLFSTIILALTVNIAAGLV